MFVYYCCYLLLITTPVSFLGATETSNQPLFHPLGQKYHCRNLSQSRVCLCGCSIPPSSSVLARFGSLLVLFGAAQLLCPWQLALQRTAVPVITAMGLPFSPGTACSFSTRFIIYSSPHKPRCFLHTGCQDREAGACFLQQVGTFHLPLIQLQNLNWNLIIYSRLVSHALTDASHAEVSSLAPALCTRVCG